MKCEGPDLRHGEKGYQNRGKKQWEINGNFEDEKRLKSPSRKRPSTVRDRLRRVVRGEAEELRGE